MADAIGVQGVCWSSTSLTVLLFGFTYVPSLVTKEGINAGSVPNNKN